MVVLSSLLGGAWFETGLGGTSAWRGWVRLGGCQAPRPSAFLAHRRQVLVTHSPLTESLSTLAAIARGVPRGSKVSLQARCRVSPARVRRPSRARFRRTFNCYYAQNRSYHVNVI